MFFISMITSLNSAFIRYLMKRKAFLNVWFPRLFDVTVVEVDNMWKYSNSPLLALGFDSMRTHLGKDLIVITETAGNRSSLRSVVVSGERHENSELYAEIAKAELTRGANKKGKSEKDFFAGVVADNVSTNRADFRILEKSLPKLLFFGCAAHCFDLLIEDIA